MAFFAKIQPNLVRFRYGMLFASIFVISIILIEISSPKITIVPNQQGLGRQEQPYLFFNTRVPMPEIKDVPEKKDGKTTAVAAPPKKPEPIPHTATILFDIDYTEGQNPYIYVEPDLIDWDASACLEQILVYPPSSAYNAYVPGNNIAGKQCRDRTINLTPYLEPGKNRLELRFSSFHDRTLLYVDSKLFGKSLVPTLGCLGLVACATALYAFIMRRVGLNIPTTVIGTLGMLYYMLPLNLRANMSGVDDLPGHCLFVQHMAHHWLKPYLYDGWESFHPPLYYMVAGPVFLLANMSHVFNPMSVVRSLALVFFMTFTLYGLRTIDEAISKKGAAYYTAIVVLIFWPLAVQTATNTNNDIPLYAVWSIAFFYLMRWYRNFEPRNLQYAIAATGIAFMIKTTAFVVAAIIAGSVGYRLLLREVPWKDFFTRGSFIAYGVLALGILVNLGRSIYLWSQGRHENNYLGIIQTTIFGPSYYMSFNLNKFMESATQSTKDPSFLNFFLKTWTVGGYNPVFVTLPVTINLFLLAFLLITVICTIYNSIVIRRYFSEMLPPILFVVLGVMAIMTFMILEHDCVCQNFRYIYPILTPLMILFIKGMESIRPRRGGKKVACLTCAIAIALPMLGLTNHVMQWYWWNIHYAKLSFVDLHIDD